MLAQQYVTFNQELSYVASTDIEILTAIFEPHINLTCWQRSLAPSLLEYVAQINAKGVDIARSLPLNELATALSRWLPEGAGKVAFIQDIEQLAQMLDCLFDNPDIGVRLKTLSQAMCPKFHTDKVVCRLVCSYSVTGTQWLENGDANRAKLGRASQGKSDETSGLYAADSDVFSAGVGDVLLLKGDAWPDNEGLGVIHRSPAINPNDKRLVLTLDLM
ncbi:DUF1826 domain-containing protein [Motilimonas cestriensis]|uniref:DUF1826 domain-containing protein n=1 Tax=Motilimonas cestriensis TaxID=2742685 RepID=A0ABS8WE46_9GAMM|nr:DUF1826 domain-containing protein [Motilimonas cestriensis]MCE2595968.1 DUF1826 domain-containing protein [Motilimonas cestriensis]